MPDLPTDPVAMPQDPAGPEITAAAERASKQAANDDDVDGEVPI